MSSRVFCLLLSVMLLGICACGKGDGRKPTFAVTGKVLDGTRPLANATVVFHPIDESGEVTKPRGKTDESGTIRLTTYDTHDGAPAGKYRVTVELWVTPNPEQGPVNRIAPRYAKPETSGLTAEVIDGPNELKPFGLKK